MKQRTWEIPADLADCVLCVAAVSQAIGTSPAGYVVTIKPQSKSDRQRKQFHADIDDIAESTGHTPAEIKDIIKGEYLGFTEIRLGDKWHKVLRSTEELDKGDYSKLIEYVGVWRSKYGV